jgi:hypothetical protein
MILSDGQMLDSVKFNALVLDVYTRFQQRLPLRFLNRTPTTPADDDEITGYFTGRVFAADVIADDSKAAVYEAGQLELVTNNIPNIKIGKRFSQAMIQRLRRIKANLTSPGIKGDVTMFTNWENNAALDLLRGIDERKNALICAMNLDAVTYDRLGVKINGSWGMPGDLKQNASAVWVNGDGTFNANATPITDVLTTKVYAESTYGEQYDRMTLSTPDFLGAVASTEFKQLIPGIVNAPILTTGYNTRDVRMPRFFSELLQMEVEQENKLMFTQSEDGSMPNSRVLPLGKVLLSIKADDNDASAMDFGNAIVTEALVAGIVGDPDNLPGGERPGPFSYFTGNADLNPPNLIAWAVARGFPRKMRKTCTSVMTVR